MWTVEEAAAHAAGEMAYFAQSHTAKAIEDGLPVESVMRIANTETIVDTFRGAMVEALMILEVLLEVVTFDPEEEYIADVLEGLDYVPRP